MTRALDRKWLMPPTVRAGGPGPHVEASQVPEGVAPGFKNCGVRYLRVVQQDADGDLNFIGKGSCV